VGPTPTLPPNHQPPPASRDRRARRPDPDADQPPATHAAPTVGREHDSDLALEDTGARLHRELTDVAARTAEQPEPLGRRLPQPLDASRQGVER
jgi:hypothetical protein